MCLFIYTTFVKGCYETNGTLLLLFSSFYFLLGGTKASRTLDLSIALSKSRSGAYYDVPTICFRLYEITVVNEVA
jgi:hypothetical protein